MADFLGQLYNREVAEDDTVTRDPLLGDPRRAPLSGRSTGRRVRAPTRRVLPRRAATDAGAGRDLAGGAVRSTRPARGRSPGAAHTSSRGSHGAPPCSPRRPGSVEDSVDGVVHFSEFPAVYEGRELSGIRLEFRDGVVVDASADNGEAFLHEALDRDAGARRLGELGVGCNPGVTRYMKNTLFDEKMDGTVHLALGQRLHRSRAASSDSVIHWDLVTGPCARTGRLERGSARCCRRRRRLAPQPERATPHSAMARPECVRPSARRRRRRRGPRSNAAGSSSTSAQYRNRASASTGERRTRTSARTTSSTQRPVRLLLYVVDGRRRGKR